MHIKPLLLFLIIQCGPVLHVQAQVQSFGDTQKGSLDTTESGDLQFVQTSLRDSISITQHTSRYPLDESRVARSLSILAASERENFLQPRGGQERPIDDPVAGPTEIPRNQIPEIHSWHIAQIGYENKYRLRAARPMIEVSSDRLLLPLAWQSAIRSPQLVTRMQQLVTEPAKSASIIRRARTVGSIGAWNRSNADDSPHATCFLINERTALTAAHAVTSPSSSTVEIHFHLLPKVLHHATVGKRDLLRDLALLHFDDPVVSTSDYSPLELPESHCFLDNSDCKFTAVLSAPNMTLIRKSREQEFESIYGGGDISVRLSPGVLPDGPINPKALLAAHDGNTIQSSSGGIVIDLAHGSFLGLHSRGGVDSSENLFVPFARVNEFLRESGEAEIK